MSSAEVTKTEEPVAAPAPVLPATTEPAVESKVEEPISETPAVAEPVVASTEETTAVAPTEEFKEEGILAYKGPGLLKSIFPSKKFFWFGSEAIEEKSLASYLRGEKDASHNVAWAAHTGEGLLLFTKKVSEKATPAGIINLSDISEVTVDGTHAFHFTLASHKHSFEAASTSERDSWVSAINTKAAAAKELAPVVAAHETYKSKLDALKPAAVGAGPVAATKKEEKKEEKAEAKEEKKEEKAEAKEEKKEEKAEKKEEKAELKEEKKEEKKRTSRSASRKRTSIFGAFGLGGKDKKEETAPAVTEPTAETGEASEVAPVAEESTPAVVEPTVPSTEEVAPAVESPAAVESKPTVSKRNSFFGTIGSKFNAKKEAKPEEVAPVVPAKDAEPVSETAPVIPAVEASEPLAATTLTPATVPTETVTTNGETKAPETPAAGTAAKDKRKSSIPWLSSKKEKATSDEESEKPKSPFSKIRNTFKSPKAKTPTTETAPTVPEAAATETTETPAVAEEEAKVEEPTVAEPVSAAPASAPVVAATA